MMNDKEVMIRNFIEFMDKKGYFFHNTDSVFHPEKIIDDVLKEYIEEFCDNPTQLPEDIYSLKEKVTLTETWVPECFYFAIKKIPYELDDREDYNSFILLTKWGWKEKDVDEAEQGYQEIHIMWEDSRKMRENQFDWADGVFWVKNMTEKEIKKELIKMGMEEKAEILEAFPYL